MQFPAVPLFVFTFWVSVFLTVNFFSGVCVCASPPSDSLSLSVTGTLGRLTTETFFTAHGTLDFRTFFGHNKVRGKSPKRVVGRGVLGS